MNGDVNNPKDLINAINKFNKTEGIIENKPQPTQQKIEKNADFEQQLIRMLQSTNENLESIKRNVQFFFWLAIITFIISAILIAI